MRPLTSQMSASSSASARHVAALLLVWYASSVVTSLSTKEIMRSFPFPITLATIQQAVAAFGGLAITPVSTAAPAGVTALLRDWRRHTPVVAPVGAVMVVALISYRWSLMSVSVSFTHTVKTLGPVFTILFSRLLLGERLPLGRYCTVLPIILGVAITTATEAEFFLVGFVAATTSTVAQALQSVLAKRALRERELPRGEFFSLTAFCAFGLLLPLFLIVDAWRLHAMSPARGALHTCRWLLFNALCSFVNQYAGLSVLDTLSSPLSYALANVMKRAAVITVAMLLAQKPVTLLHLFGVGLSVFGAFVYQQLAAWRRSASYERLPLIGEGSPQPSFEAGAAAPGAVTPLPPAVNGGGGGIGGGTATARIFATLSTDTAGIALGARPGGRDFRPAGGAPETPG